ncbi:LysR substrate-binding domain-containing protein [Variovorax sp. PBL-E5]|uniref:LysR substrate-binding domain-containing protein n=1 Tax=Variovorax sp. PBL-E5 TaxID=434014 RepID=UPI001317F33D|nr:LysR substrate-binding domain-containing protein [Variovorax sp. PBL-E5]VTU39179.1 Gcv operon activator [Variovorax sp. PBL-E5]
MPARLPPLNAVRAFVAAARQQSFTRAAAELHVTHSAVSRQIKGLEAHLGVALFERRVRQVTLTAEGQRFYAEAAAGLAQIGAAALALMARAPSRAVRISVRPSFAVRWLIPRLPAFVEQYPGIEPQIVTSTELPADVPEGFDVAIRRGLEGWPRAIEVRPFLEDEVRVVGAPSLFRMLPVDAPRGLAAHVLLSARTRRQDWDDWKRQFGIARLKPAGRLQFDHLHLVLQAAIDGLGVAMGPTSLVAHDLAFGRLQSPLPEMRMPLPRYYYGLAPGAAPEAAFFAEWLENARRADPLPLGGPAPASAAH